MCKCKLCKDDIDINDIIVIKKQTHCAGCKMPVQTSIDPEWLDNLKRVVRKRLEGRANF
jgi:hypothetical protein